MTTAPSVELTFDALAHEYETGCPYNRYRHRLITHCWWLNAFKKYARRCGCKYADSLAIYFHELKGTYVLFLWLIKPDAGRGPGLMRELEILKGHPDRLEWDGATRRPPQFAYILNALRPAIDVARAAKRRIIAAARDTANDRQEGESHRFDVARFHEKQGNHDLARALRSGAVPWASPKVAGDAQDLINAASGKYIVNKD